MLTPKLNQKLNHKYAGLIFDLDNTLVSSSLNFITIRNAINCPNNSDILSFIHSLPPKQKKHAEETIHHYEMLDANNAIKLTGTDEILALVTQLQIPYAIVTRNNTEAALLKIKNNSLPKSTLITRELFKPKPAPDVVFHLAKQWQCKTESILCVGDYLYDIEMANNAKATSCLITYGDTLAFSHLASFTVKNLPELHHILSKK